MSKIDPLSVLPRLMLLSLPFLILILLFVNNKKYEEKFSELKEKYIKIQKEYVILGEKKEEQIKSFSSQYVTLVDDHNKMKTYLESYDNFQKALAEVDAVPYDKEAQNCYDHSKLLQQKLEEHNIKSSIFINKERNHAWVAVWLETDDGSFVGVDKDFRGAKDFYYPIEVRDNNQEVICN